MHCLIQWVQLASHCNLYVRSKSFGYKSISSAEQCYDIIDIITSSFTELFLWYWLCIMFLNWGATWYINSWCYQTDQQKFQCQPDDLTDADMQSFYACVSQIAKKENIFITKNPEKSDQPAMACLWKHGKSTLLIAYVLVLILKIDFSADNS